MKLGIDAAVIGLPETHPTISDSIKKIISAIENNELNELNRLLSIPAVRSNIDQDDSLKMDLLKKAAEQGSLPIVNRILEIESVKNALLLCEYLNPFEILRILLNKGYVDIINRLTELNGFSRFLPNTLRPEAYRDHLIKAIERNDLSMVACLIKLFHPDYFEEFKENRICNQVLAYAAKCGNVAILKLLYDKFNTSKGFEISVEVLQWAAMQGHLQAVEYLLTLPQIFKKAEDNNNYALRKAAQNGHLDVVKCLLNVPCVEYDVAAVDNYAMRLAKQNGHETVVEYLCQFQRVRECIESENKRMIETLPKASLKDLSFEPLDWRKRPEETQKKIAHAFESVNEKDTSLWRSYNGANEYGMCRLSEHHLIKTIILKNPDRKEFNVLDIGAGNFQFGRALAWFLNNDRDIPKDIKVNIIGIRGEQNKQEAERTDGICKLYEFGSFPVENLVDEFAKRGLELKNKVDVAVSRWCFIHLMDPLGTFLQTYSLLRPKTGFLSMDGFYYGREGSDIERNANMDFLLIETNAPFIIRKLDSHENSLDQFILRRPNENELRIPLSYTNTFKKDIIQFKKTIKDDPYPQTRRYTLNYFGYGNMIGNKEIFDFFSKNDLFLHSDIELEHLHKDPEYLGSFFSEHHDISRYVDKHNESPLKVKYPEQEIHWRASPSVWPSSSSSCSLSSSRSLPAAVTEVDSLPSIPSSSDDSNLIFSSPQPTRPAIQVPVKSKRTVNTADKEICSQLAAIASSRTRRNGAKRKSDETSAAPVTPLFSLEARKNRRKNNAKKVTSLPSTLETNDGHVSSRTRSQCKRRK